MLMSRENNVKVQIYFVCKHVLLKVNVKTIDHRLKLFGVKTN